MFCDFVEEFSHATGQEFINNLSPRPLSGSKFEKEKIMKIDTQKALFVCEIEVPALNGKVLLSHSGYGLSIYDDGNGHTTAYERLRALYQYKEVDLREDGFIYYGEMLLLRRKFMKMDGEVFVLSGKIEARNRNGEWTKFHGVDWHSR